MKELLNLMIGYQRDFYRRTQRSWGKVIFSQASVILLTGEVPARGVWWGGVCSRGVWSQGEVSAPRVCAWWRPPPPRDSHCCGRYASYWNAFLFKWIFAVLFNHHEVARR